MVGRDQTRRREKWPGCSRFLSAGTRWEPLAQQEFVLVTRPTYPSWCHLTPSRARARPREGIDRIPTSGFARSSLALGQLEARSIVEGSARRIAVDRRAATWNGLFDLAEGNTDR